MNSLYVTDLDGTLLNPTGVLSKKNHPDSFFFIAGVSSASIATARTPLGISNILKDSLCHFL